MNTNEIIQQLKAALADTAKDGGMAIQSVRNGSEIEIGTDAWFTNSELRKILDIADRHGLSLEFKKHQERQMLWLYVRD